MGFEGLWATRTLAPHKRPDKSQLASAEQASTDPLRERYGISNTLTYPQHGRSVDGHWENTGKNVSSIWWVIDERNLGVTTITVWVLSPRRLWVMGYWGPMGYGVEFPLSRLGKAKILWVFGVYGLPGVWVRRVSTVPTSFLVPVVF
ncbi:hypothetical protein BD309DRAFT_765368 [Dichomitus squalens]|uniref:Uncharacterized protein n=1 Tax=Dichomitus squalens TaxID=114155 RepID=A0A4Q9PP58_9APHY|nr:hypothetical protein BD309DRAFT_765368 [Dichomitus squalens]TBU56093.1 hypothetical protein BD310DRAFT_883200 [Dichomitus squalens]